MIVVSDTSPLNYLVLIRAEHVLPILFGRIIAPPAVLTELRRPKAPAMVRLWAATPPAWLEIQPPTTVIGTTRLGLGESEAIALAQELKADAVLIDERDGTKFAQGLGLHVVGTLGVLERAAEKGLLSLPVAIADLRRTTFRGPAQLIAEYLQRDQARRPQP